MTDIIYEKQDLRYLNWSTIRRSSGTAGSFLKSREETDDGKIYYKLSSYDAFHGVTGHECVNEIIADRLLTVLGIEHLSYQLIHAVITVDQKDIETWLCASGDFKHKGESKIALDAYYQAEKQENESPLDFCIRCGWEKTVYEMLVFDYLILNHDRHDANMEVLRSRKDRTVRLAPLFDHGISLLFHCADDAAAEKENLLADKPVQCFVGSRSARSNLNLIPPDRYPQLNCLKKSDRSFVTGGLDQILSVAMSERIWEMIWKRWEVYEDLCNQR